MTTFQICHLRANRKLSNARRHIYDFIDADIYFIREVLVLHFVNGLHPLTLVFFPNTSLIFGKG